MNAQNLDRLQAKFEMAADLVPAPVRHDRDKTSKLGLINFGSTEPAVREGLDQLEREGYKLNALRIKAFPFTRELQEFADAHEQIFVVEQNRDAQMRTLLITEAGLPAEKLIPVLDYAGMPLSAAFVRKEIQAFIEGDQDGDGSPRPPDPDELRTVPIDLHQEAQCPPSETAQERARSHPPRL